MSKGPLASDIWIAMVMLALVLAVSTWFLIPMVVVASVVIAWEHL